MLERGLRPRFFVVEAGICAKMESVKRLTPQISGLLQALGIVLYVVVFVLVLQGVIPKDADLGPIIAPIFMLLAFSTSALICASIVLLRPALLFFSDRKKEAVQIVLWTAGWLAIILFLCGSWLFYAGHI